MPPENLGENFPWWVLVLFVAFSLSSCGPVMAAPVDIVQTIIMAESSGNPGAIGDDGESRGLMQLNEPTWKRYTSRPFKDALNPTLNRQIGEMHLRYLIRRYRTTDPAYLCYRWNCGEHTKLSFSDWKKKQHNKVYRSLYTGEAS